jgi:hypothetical protein
MPVKVRRSKGRTSRVAAIGICIIGLVCIGHILSKELVVVKLESRMERQTGLLNRRETDVVASIYATPSYAVARGALANAVTLAQAAQFQPDTNAKARNIALARDDIDLALTVRPAWGEAWMTKSYIAAIDKGPDSTEALEALTRSYEQAPFLRHAADWRVTLSFDQWKALSPAARTHAVDEAVWAGALDGALRVRFFQLARNSAAYPALANRWRQMRITKH